jgi:hypothetical protein
MTFLAAAESVGYDGNLEFTSSGYPEITRREGEKTAYHGIMGKLTSGFPIVN